MSTRAWGIVAVSSLAVTVALSVAGHLLERRGPVPPAAGRAIVAVAVAAFVALVVATPPLVLRAFLAAQVAIGNAEHPMVAFLLRHEAGAVRGAWALIALGAAIALPAILRDLGLRG